MSLDFTVLDENRAPQKTVPISADLHYELIATALDLGLSRFVELSDFYEDVEIDVVDLNEFLDQVKEIKVRSSSTELRQFLNDLDGLVEYAISCRKALNVLAD